MEESKPKPLSYDALKSVLKHTSFEKREEIHRRIPQLRKTNAIIPYQRRSVMFYFEHHIVINDLVWRFDNVQNEQLGTYEPNKCTRYLNRPFPNKSHAKPIILDKSPNDAFEELLKNFISNGTTIKCLHVYHVPQYILSQNPEHFKLKVSEMYIRLPTLEEFIKMLPYINEKTLTYMEFSFSKNIALFLDVSLVRNCPKLKIDFIRDENSFPWHKLHLLRNNHVHINCFEFPRDTFQALVMNWKEPGRLIGSTFFLTILHRCVIEMKVKLNELMDLLTTHHGAVPSELPENLSIDRCVTMKVTNDNNSELVAYIETGTHGLPSLTMKIMHAGATTVLSE